MPRYRFDDLQEITGQKRPDRAKRYFLEFVQYAQGGRGAGPLQAVITFTVPSDKSDEVVAVDVRKWLGAEDRHPLTPDVIRELKEMYQCYWNENRRAQPT